MREAAVAHEDALVARYVLCTFVDTAVLNTPWGAQGDWAGQSLLVMFHKEVSGGTKFFEILERLRAEPDRYIGLIELVYVCLALGYEGKYRHDPTDRPGCRNSSTTCIGLVRARRALQGEDLSPHWKGVEDRRNPVMRYVPWWVVAIAGVAVLTIAFIVLRTRLGLQAEPIEAALAHGSSPGQLSGGFAAARKPAEGAAGSQEAAGRLRVEEIGDKTVVTLIAPSLFGSGSARLNPDLVPDTARSGTGTRPGARACPHCRAYRRPAHTLVAVRG